LAWNNGITLTNLIDVAIPDFWSGATVPADPDACCDDHGFGIDSSGTIAFVCYTGPAYVVEGQGLMECTHDFQSYFAFPSEHLQVDLGDGGSFISPVTQVNQYFRTVQTVTE